MKLKRKINDARLGQALAAIGLGKADRRRAIAQIRAGNDLETIEIENGFPDDPGPKVVDLHCMNEREFWRNLPDGQTWWPADSDEE